MAGGDILYATAPITINPDGTADTAAILALDGLFDDASFDSITMQIVPDLGKGGNKQVLVVVGRDTTAP